jgi:hypothetical protein
MSPRAILSAVALAGLSAAQCPFTSVTAQSAGAFCNVGPTGCCAVAEQPTQLAASLDVGACALDLQVSALEGCCGVAVAARLLVLGDLPAAIPVPQFGPRCTVWVQPAVVLVRTSGDTFRLPIPANLPPLTLRAQAAAIISNPFPTPSFVNTLTEAYTVALQ